MLNNVVLIGRITKHPELQIFGETKVCNFDIAFDNVRKDKNGERGTSFLPVVTFGSIAESVATYLDKGVQIAVVGSIEQRNYLRQDGSKGSVVEIIASSVQFLDKPKEKFEDSVKVSEAIQQPVQTRVYKSYRK